MLVRVFKYKLFVVTVDITEYTTEHTQERNSNDYIQTANRY